MRGRAAVIVWMVLGFVGAKCAEAVPQEPAKQYRTVEPEENTNTEPETRPIVQARADKAKNDKDEDTETSVTLPHNAIGLGSRFLQDQKQIWTSPAKIRFSDTQWLVPAIGLTAGLITTDASYNRHLSHDPSTVSRYNNLSNASVAALIGGAGGMWLLSYHNHNEHWRETGFLAGEAAINSLIVVEGLKYSTRRERPDQGNGDGKFFQSGGTSFPSEHAAAAWSVAGVIAHEYPGPLTKIMAYGLASVVTFSRVRAQKHFPSDVLVGTVVGNLVAQNIYSRNSDPSLGGSEWRSISQFFRSDGNLSVSNLGSPYVPLDSWIYPAFDRLTALGAIESAFLGMRPWTRNECVRLLGEAKDRVQEEGIGGVEAEKTYRQLETEFQGDMEEISSAGHSRIRVESMYSRVTGVSGQALTDGNHFGQTVINDFGRPYQEGFNTVDGFSLWATSAHWVGYLRAEYQHSPEAPAQSAAAREFIASVDNIPGVPPATPYAEVNRVRLLDAYVGLNFENWQVTYGRQSLSWGSTAGGPFIFTNNAEPVNMFRVNRVAPFKLPWIFGWLLGPMEAEWFLGQLAGHDFVFQTDTGIVGQFGVPLSRQPFLQGQKLSMKPTPNFEFSVATTTVFAGGPTPLTWHTFLRSYSIGQGGAGQTSGPGDPGDRRSSVDFAYKIPGMRNWLTFYGDAMTEDEFSPLGYPRKSAFRGGIYVAKFPGISKLDLRVEGGSTSPVDFLQCTGCFYDNLRYPDGSYTNLDFLMGSWLGRGSQGEQAWATYWISPRNTIQFQYRHQKVDPAYLPHGGTLNDGGVKIDLQLRPNVTFSGFLQYEKWNYPLLSSLPQFNWTTSIGVTFWPQKWALQSR